jgi:predicted metal-dependent enzyme (double-stranded beta helix superfamily)
MSTLLCQLHNRVFFVFVRCLFDFDKCFFENYSKWSIFALFRGKERCKIYALDKTQQPLVCYLF